MKNIIRNSFLVAILTATIFFGLDVQFAHARRAESVAMWQKWSGMVNVLELINAADVNKRYRVTAYNSKGEIIAVKNFSVEAKKQRDISVNKEFLNNQNDQSGYVVIRDISPVPTAMAKGGLDYEDMIFGNMVQYRYSADGSKVDCAVSNQFDFYGGIQYQTSYLMYNSQQPQLYEPGSSAPVSQILSIINMQDTEAKFKVATYDETGKYLFSNIVTIPAHGRSNIHAGESDSRNRSKRGVHKIAPYGAEYQLYAAQLFRFSAGVEDNGHTHGFCMMQQSSSGFFVEFVPISASSTTNTFVEIANTAAKDITDGKLYFYKKDGSRLTRPFSLKANAVKHVEINSIFPYADIGYLVVDAEGEYSEVFSRTSSPVKGINPTHAVHLYSATYYRHENGDLIGSASIAGGLPIVTDGYPGSYNMKKDSNNVVRLSNFQSTKQSVRLSAYTDGGIKTKTYNISPHKTISIPLQSDAIFGSGSGVSGILLIEGEVFGHVLRLGGARVGDKDFYLSTPVGIVSRPML